jgi:hypothetical protein
LINGVDIVPRTSSASGPTLFAVIQFGKRIMSAADYAAIVRDFLDLVPLAPIPSRTGDRCRALGA